MSFLNLNLSLTSKSETLEKISLQDRLKQRNSKQKQTPRIKSLDSIITWMPSLVLSLKSWEISKMVSKQLLRLLEDRLEITIAILDSTKMMCIGLPKATLMTMRNWRVMFTRDSWDMLTKSRVSRTKKRIMKSSKNRRVSSTILSIVSSN